MLGESQSFPGTATSDEAAARYFAQKARNLVRIELAVEHALQGMSEKEFFHGTRDTHIAEAPFFFELIWFEKGAGVGKNTFLKPHQKNHREL